jgi:hypothetical protein
MQNPLHQSVSVFHFINRFFVLMLAELDQSPIVEHAGVEKILIDGSQLVLEGFIQVLDNLGIAFHLKITPGGLEVDSEPGNRCWSWFRSAGG